MVDYKWPEDEEFKRFARKLADAVTVFVAKGRKIAPVGIGYGREDCDCPLGALTDTRYPYGRFAYRPDMVAFMNAFDHGSKNANIPSKQTEPYYMLGLAYRERFVYGDS